MAEVAWAEMTYPDGFKYILCGQDVDDETMGLELLNWLKLEPLGEIKVWLATPQKEGK